MNNHIKYWLQIFLLPIYFLSHLIPRNERIWVLGSSFGKRFADNPRYFYLYLRQHKKEEVRAIWISKNREIIKQLEKYNYEGYYLYSIKGIYYSLIAKVYLYDNYSKDICFWLSGGAVKINLWHGIPLKKINLDNKFDYARHPRSFREFFCNIFLYITNEKPKHFVVTTSKYMKKIFQSAFGTRKVIVSGYPRIDYLAHKNLIKNIYTAEEERVLDDLKKWKSSNKKIILYMPTFRDSERMLNQVIDFEQFNTFLEKEESLFCIKLHPKSKVLDLLKRFHYSNIYIINKDVDPYSILTYTNILITDYSSIYFDYLVLDRPIIFFPYDYEEYVTKSRELYFEYNKITPGEKVYTMEELMRAVENGRYSPNYIKLQKQMRDTFVNNNKISCEALYNYIAYKIL